MTRLFSEEEVAKHNSAFNCWIVLGAHGAKKVYDVTAFLEDHPGGPEVLLDLGGQDAEDEFQDVGHSKEARAILGELYIGDLKEDGDWRAIQEANKISRRSLLTHSELIQRQRPQTTHAWPQVMIIASLAITIAAFVLSWVYPDAGGAAWQTLRASWQR